LAPAGVGLHRPHQFEDLLFTRTEISHPHPGVKPHLVRGQVTPHQHFGVGQDQLQLFDAPLQALFAGQGGLEIRIFLRPPFRGGLQDFLDHLGALHPAQDLQFLDDLFVAGPG
jgi:hypothetical protein